MSKSIFKIFYPTVFYNPNNKEKPISIIYKSISFPFSHNLVRTDELFFSRTIVENESGLFFSHKKNDSYWTVEAVNNYNFLKMNEILEDSATSSNIYHLHIFQSKNVTFHQRKYKTLTEVISYVFCYIEIIYQLMCLAFDSIFIPIITNIKLMQLFFEDNTDNSNKNKTNVSSFLSLRSSEQFKSKIKTFELCSSKNIKNKNEHSEQKVKSFSIYKDKNLRSNNQKAIPITSYFAYKIKLYFCMKPKKVNEISKFKTAEILLKQNYDFQKYTKMIYELQIIKKCLFTKECIIIENNFKRYNINQIQQSEKVYDLLKKYTETEIMQSINQLKERYFNLIPKSRG